MTAESKPAQPASQTSPPAAGVFTASQIKPAAAAVAQQPASPEAAPQKQAAAVVTPVKPPAPKPPQPSAIKPVPQPPQAKAATLKARHFGIFISFLLMVLAPLSISTWYLWGRAADQYASYLGFSVRSESAPSPTDLFGGLGALAGISSGSSTDTDILYKFIQSHDLVQRLDSKLDLREIWSKAPDDPVFAYRGNDALEDLMVEWKRKVHIYFEDGIIDIRVLAFEPGDAQAISRAILDEGTILINELNDVAREDKLRYAREELDESVERLKKARQAVTSFRNRHQMVDPTVDVEGQAGVVASLQQQLATDLVQLGLLKANASESDPRFAQAELRIQVIRDQIEAERNKFGSETSNGSLLSDVVGQYESLAVDQQFAEQAYVASLAAYDVARAAAERQTRYLAAYVKPTLAQEAEYPERSKLLFILGGFLLLIWITGVLIYYSLRDRR